MYSLKLSMDNVTIYTETVYNLIQQIQQEIWTKIGKSRLFAYMHMTKENVILDINWFKRITFHGSS